MPPTDAGPPPDLIPILATRLAAAVAEMPPPAGWTRKRGAGRPRKRQRGHREEFSWQAVASALALKQHLGLDYRSLAARLAADPHLRAGFGLSRAPSPATLQRGHARLDPGWWDGLWRRLGETFGPDAAVAPWVGRGGDPGPARALAVDRARPPPARSQSAPTPPRRIDIEPLH